VREHVPIPRAAPAPKQRVARSPAVTLPNSVMRRLLQRTPSVPTADKLIAKVKVAPAGSKGQRKALVDMWAKEMGKLLDTASGGSHSAEVMTNERGEITDHVKALYEAAEGLGANDFRDAVVRLTQTKLQELGIELRHDVVIKAGSAGWLADDLLHVDAALTGMPGDWNPAAGKAITFAEVTDPADTTGGETDVDNVITMHRRGMRSKDYKDDCPGLKGLTTHQHSIRHEIGHTVHNRMRAKADELFTMLDWHEFVPSLAEHRKGLEKDTGLSGAELDAFVAKLTKKRTVHKGRTYFKSDAGLVHSLGKPTELPDEKEFDYAYWSQSEYFPEIYSYLIDAPALMKAKLSQKQLDWWKDNVFGGTLPTAPAP
jgi:hypothetical protein